MNSHERARAGAVVERPAEQMWEVLRDFNQYPTYIRAVEESMIEDELTGTTVGAVRRFRMGEVWTRQRLVALSDVDRFFTYASTEPLQVENEEVLRELTSYQGTVRLHPTTVDGRCYVDWATSYVCPAGDAKYWEAWWTQALATWLDDVRAAFCTPLVEEA